MRPVVGSYVDNSEEVNPIDPAQNEVIRTRCWVDTIGQNNKEKLYAVGHIGTSYKDGNDTLKQHFTSSCNIEDISQLKQHLSVREKVS